jgi:hypothetical protein
MHGSESDVDADAKTARSRETGGDPDRGKHEVHPDAAETTTGTGENEEFVGRVSGVDETSAGETGAEARARAGEGR